MANVLMKDIKKIYNQGTDHEVRALDGVSFSLEAGEFVVILGASGAGKSTLLNILGGMDNATSGEYIVDNVDVTKYSEKDLGKYRREQVGFVFQFYNLMPNLTAIENIQIAESISKNPLSSYDVIKSVNLDKRANNFPSELSGGEQQRVAIARALVKNPALLLCDEPTGALDSKTGALIIELLLKVAKEFNKTVVIVTHNSKIASVASRVIHIQDGRIVKDYKNDNPIKPSEVEW